MFEQSLLTDPAPRFAVPRPTPPSRKPPCLRTTSPLKGDPGGRCKWTIYRDLRDGVPYLVLVTSKQTLEQKPEVIRSAVRAFTRAMKFAR